jgi:hypothetical protein
MSYRLGMTPPDLAGKRFARLFVLRKNETLVGNCVAWVCMCDCGTEKVARGTHLLTGAVKSCGCLRRSSGADRTRTHGMSKTKIYRIWVGMHRRCFKSSDEAFKNYGARGIKVCAHWLRFENFLTDMGERPRGMSLDRIDNDGSYEPGNCRWATPAQQGNNTRKVRIITFGGESMTISEWAQKLGLKRTCLTTRLRIMTVARALTFNNRGAA